ncbi:glycerol kinase [Barrientosiimonas humi]|uniref:Glycerol kinase n=1 Tax=Barrientosiimonas humi TaxID=999931 RepID=A0A542WZH6_9MICO|nr:glycerol kinase GlpK [Barrientosiimonas humi]TQL28980.1 glycerol kinase [Barrientosiimonas humi]CAG7571420.1 Glycerol kinase [Barrientosiimonas humi]
MSSYIAAIDQGTTSTRCMIFDHDGKIAAVAQMEHEQIFPKAGWVEHDAKEIWNNTRKVTAEALAQKDLKASDIAAVGITNQRETALVWDKTTGEPVYNAIVWQDTRTDDICDELGALGGGAERYRDKVGLPLATYFSGPKVRWILDNVDGAREKAEKGDLLFGNMDTWLVWNMTGGVEGGVHITDVTNASRTLLMDLSTLDWDESIAEDMKIPMSMLPEIRSSAEEYGKVRERGVLGGVPIAGILGDQQAATFGQVCFEPGTAKNTYGTGNFLLLNTGEEKVMSKNGLITTVCYKIGENKPIYALEGSIAVTGSLVQWLRDNLGLIKQAPEVEDLAKKVEDNGDVYVVPAFSGLFAPHWRSDARGVIVGLTRYANKNHIARAALEAVAFQSKEVVDAMNADSGVDLSELKVDGGMVGNDTPMQFQADLLGVPVIRPEITETTCLGAAYAAGLAVGFWKDEDELRKQWAEDKRWEPEMDSEQVTALMTKWDKAVKRTLDWVKDTDSDAAPEAPANA